jgi:hypothetical protein
VTKAEIRQYRLCGLYGEKLDKVFQKFPRPTLRFVLNGINGPQGGTAGMLLAVG